MRNLIRLGHSYFVVIVAAALVASGAACGGSPAVSAPLVTADPKTLVLQPGDYPSNWSDDPNNQPVGQPTGGLGLPAKNKTKPLDAYLVFIPFQSLDSIVALYHSADEAQAVFASIAPPNSGQVLSFLTETNIDFSVGDQQKAFAFDLTSNAHEVDLYWRSGNVISVLAFLKMTTKYYPTTASLAADDYIDMMFFEQLAPRVQTHLRLAMTGH